MAELAPPDAFVDSRECVLMVWITEDGDARTHSRLERAEAARMLRCIADAFDPPAGGEVDRG